MTNVPQVPTGIDADRPRNSWPGMIRPGNQGYEMTIDPKSKISFLPDLNPSGIQWVRIMPIEQIGPKSFALHSSAVMKVWEWCKTRPNVSHDEEKGTWGYRTIVEFENTKDAIEFKLRFG